MPPAPTIPRLTNSLVPPQYTQSCLKAVWVYSPIPLIVFPPLRYCTMTGLSPALVKHHLFIATKALIVDNPAFKTLDQKNNKITLLK